MISWLFVSLVMAILLTPGPTNTLLASSGIESGFKKSLTLIPVEALGYVIAISIWGIAIDTVADKFPVVPSIMKLLSALYIIFLALKLWKTASIEDAQPSITFKTLFFATLLNPKALLFASAIFPMNTWVSLSGYLYNMSVFILIIVPIAIFWILIGAVLISNRIVWLNQKNLKRCASLVLVSFSIPLSYSALISF